MAAWSPAKRFVRSSLPFGLQVRLNGERGGNPHRAFLLLAEIRESRCNAARFP